MAYGFCFAVSLEFECSSFHPTEQIIHKSHDETAQAYRFPSSCDTVFVINLPQTPRHVETFFSQHWQKTNVSFCLKNLIAGL